MPDELALAGCDNDELVCNFARIPLSSYEAARLLDQLMDGARPPRQTIRVPHKGITIRQSSDVLAIEHPGLARTMRSIGINYDDRALSAERLARDASMTRQGLNKASRQHLGRTVSEEIRRIRLAKAIELLGPDGVAGGGAHAVPHRPRRSCAAGAERSAPARRQTLKEKMDSARYGRCGCSSRRTILFAFICLFARIFAAGGASPPGSCCTAGSIDRCRDHCPDLRRLSSLSRSLS